jgi:hypothetical protein
MRAPRQLISLLVGVLFPLFSGGVVAKEWRGIVPLKSTREDVLRLLGPPKQQTEAAYYYALADELVLIWVQHQACDQCGLGWKVPVGTVTSIGVIPRSVKGKSKPADLDGFTVRVEHAGFVYYFNESKGLTVETLNGQVTSLQYRPEGEQANLECVRKDCIVDTFPNFDAYGDLTWSDEKARLDNYGIRLNYEILRGAIVVYGKDRAVRSRLIKRATRARSYLSRQGIEPERILIVDGGYQTDSYLALQIYSIAGFGSYISVLSQSEPARSLQNRRKRKQRISFTILPTTPN